jgi:hypothetical protein
MKVVAAEHHTAVAAAEHHMKAVVEVRHRGRK